VRHKTLITKQEEHKNFNWNASWKEILLEFEAWIGG